MTLFKRTIAVTVTAFGIAFCWAPHAAAQKAPVRVLTSNGMKAVIQELQPGCEGAIGHSLAIEFGSTSGLKQQIESGAQFDVAILAMDTITELARKNKVVEAGIADLARTGIGIGVRSGAPKPDIHSPDALKQTLSEAASITYAKDGASRANIEKMFEALGVGEAVKAKAILTQGSGPAMESVASGKAAIVITLMSELITVPGIEVAGPLPDKVQNYVTFAAAVNPGSHQSQPARALLACLKNNTAAPVYRAKGMEPR